MNESLCFSVNLKRDKKKTISHRVFILWLYKMISSVDIKRQLMIDLWHGIVRHLGPHLLPRSSTSSGRGSQSPAQCHCREVRQILSWFRRTVFIEIYAGKLTLNEHTYCWFLHLNSFLLQPITFELQAGILSQQSVAFLWQEVIRRWRHAVVCKARNILYDDRQNACWSFWMWILQSRIPVSFRFDEKDGDRACPPVAATSGVSSCDDSTSNGNDESSKIVWPPTITQSVQTGEQVIF